MSSHSIQKNPARGNFTLTFAAHYQTLFTRNEMGCIPFHLIKHEFNTVGSQQLLPFSLEFQYPTNRNCQLLTIFGGLPKLFEIRNRFQ